MGSAAWKSFIGLGKEVTWGTAVAPSVWLTYHGAPTIKQAAGYLDLAGTQETRGDEQDVVSQFTLEGEIPDIEVSRAEFDLLLEAAFGTVAAGVYTLKDGTLPSLTVEENKGGVQGFRYVGCKVNAMSLAAALNETLKAAVSIVGKSATPIAVGALTARAWLDKQPWVFYQGAFTFNSVAVPIWGFDVELNNNLKHPNHATGSQYTLEQVEGKYEVTGSFRLDFSDTTFYDRHQAGTQAAASLLFSGYGGSSFKVEFPALSVREHAIEEADQDNPQEITFKALRSGVNGAMKITLITV